MRCVLFFSAGAMQSSEIGMFVLACMLLTNTQPCAWCFATKSKPTLEEEK
jgi:hypothetical protein